MTLWISLRRCLKPGCSEMGKGDLGSRGESRVRPGQERKSQESGKERHLEDSLKA